MTKGDREQVREAIRLLAADDADRDLGMAILFRLAGLPFRLDELKGSLEPQDIKALLREAHDR